MLNADRIAIRPTAGRELSAVPALVAMSASIMVALVLLIGSGYALDGYPYAFLLPWIGGLSVTLSIPSIILYRKGRFTFADPLVRLFVRLHCRPEPPDDSMLAQEVQRYAFARLPQPEPALVGAGRRGSGIIEID